MASFRFNCCTPLRFIPLLLFLLVLTESSQMVAGRIVVGDRDRWRAGVNYTAWAEGRHFHVEDWLAFYWTKGLYDVIEVTAADYEACKVDNPLWNWSRGNRAAYQLTESKHYYFTCSMGYCKDGMKLTLFAEPLPSSSPSPSPSSSPVPKPLPPQSSPPSSPVLKPLPPKSSPSSSPVRKPLPPQGSPPRSPTMKQLPPQSSPSRSPVPKTLPPQISPSRSPVRKPLPPQSSSSPSPLPEQLPSNSSPSPSPNAPRSGAGSWVTVDLTRGTLLTALAFVLALV